MAQVRRKRTFLPLDGVIDGKSPVSVPSGYAINLCLVVPGIVMRYST